MRFLKRNATPAMSPGGLLLVVLACVTVSFPVHAETPPAEQDSPPQPAAEAQPPAGPQSNASETGTEAVREIVPWRGKSPQRPPVQGEWRPTLLLPNDLTDPPENYPHCPGGACVGMTAVTNAIWASPIEQGWLPAREFARRAIHAMLPDPRGRYLNPTLRSHVMLDDRLLKYDDPEVLRFVAEWIQRRIQPLTGEPTPVAEIRSQYREVLRVPGRLGTIAELRSAVQSAGGRMVVGLLFYNRDLTKKAGHAVILTVDEDGQFHVWDPNARMEREAVGSGRLAPVDISATDDGRIREISYAIELPDRSTQQRRFNFVFPVRSLIDARRIPPRPQGGR